MFAVLHWEARNKEGIAQSEEEATGSAEGYSAGGRIAISQGLDGTNKALTLIHEFA